MFNKKMFMKKQKLKERISSILEEDKYEETIKLERQRYNKINESYNEINKALLNFGTSVLQLEQSMQTVINKIRSHPDIIL